MAAGGAKKPGEKVSTEGIEVALNPEELDLDTAAMQAKYDQTMREQQSQLEKEDLSDMVAEHAAKQKVSLCSFIQHYLSPVYGTHGCLNIFQFFFCYLHVYLTR